MYHFQVGNNDKDGDPGIIILYGTDAEIHASLGVAAVGNIPSLQQGRLNVLCTNPTSFQFQEEMLPNHVST